MSTTESCNSQVNINITLNYEGIMTLNGFNSNFINEIAPMCNAPFAVSSIQSSSSSGSAVTAIIMTSQSEVPWGTNSVYYNMPDGSLLEIAMKVTFDFGGTPTYSVSPTLSTGSLFNIGFDNTQSGPTFNISLQM